MNRWMQTKGFTIVELLIVVVVIAILAAITIVSYNGIQQRAYNSSMLTTAKQTYTALLQYTSENGRYPLTTSDSELCLTRDNKCTTNLQQTVGSNNTSLVTALNAYGGLPKSAPAANTREGIVYYRYPTQTYNGVADTAYVYFVLKGEGQKCSVGETVGDARNQPSVTTSTTGYSWSGGGVTGCYIYIHK